MVPIALEDGAQARELPSVKWTWYAVVGEKAYAKRGGTLKLPSEHGLVLSEVEARPSFIHWQVESPEWEVTDQSLYTELPDAIGQKSAEGAWKSGTLWAATRPVLVRRTVVDVWLRGLPEGAAIRAGEQLLRRDSTRSDRVEVRLPRAFAEAQGAALLVEHQDDSVRKVLELPLRDLLGKPNAYRPLELVAVERMWRLDGLPKLQVPAMELLDRVEPKRLRLDHLVRGDDVLKVLGEPDSDTPDRGRGTYGFSDGARNWYYRETGVELKLRRVYLANGTIDLVLERLSLTKPESGDVGGVRAGDAASRAIERFGGGEVISGFGFESPGFSSYLGGGLAVVEDVHSGRIERIEIRRPLAYLRQGLAPTRLSDPAMARVVSINYRTGEVTLELGLNSPAKIGQQFTLFNIDVPAIPYHEFGEDVFAQVTSQDGPLAVCRLVLGKGSLARELGQERARAAVKLILHPVTGFAYAVMRSP
ncbi:MAG TPA: hypothetical protein VM328_09750 [Fimbriimonadaceae bacterium]|nr:hypothetical protein [Fimbriimonadaceae bacterium]